MSEADSNIAGDFKEGAGPAALWAGLLAGPLAVLLQLEINYALVLRACRSGEEFWLHVVSLAALALTAVGGLLSWRNHRRAGGEWDDEGAGVLPRSRLMAAVGILISILMALVVIAQWIPVFVYGPCQR
jgi:hypothetical protein